MSGIAIAASTMPGSVATFSSCSSERSSRIASSSSWSANSRAGTRMSARAVGGISHIASSIRTGSDIEHQRGAPRSSLLLHREAMVGDGLDQVGGVRPAPADRRVERIADQLEALRALGQESLRLDQIDELAEPLGEQRRAVGRARGDLEAGRRAARAGLRALAQQLPEGLEGLVEDGALTGGLDPQLELGGVVHPLVHPTARIVARRWAGALAAERVLVEVVARRVPCSGSLH